MTTRPYQPFGAARAILSYRGPEVILDGPAGTGKSRACLEKAFAIAQKYPGSRGLIVRRTRESLTEAALVTWEQHVVPEGHPCLTSIQRRNRQSYTFPNGSVVNVGGLDKPTKVMSTEYDWIYVQEAIELAEAEWEALTTRLRNGKVPYQQIFGDTNPDSPTHWIKQREGRGTLKLINSRHEDNPVYWDAHHSRPTEIGAAYLARLDNLTGVRKERLRYGKWVAAEGLVYELWDTAVHIIDRSAFATTCPGWEKWPRYWGIDFGFTNPFVWQEWVQDPDSRLYLVREMYQTKRLVEDMAADILAATGRKMTFDSQGRPTGRIVATRENPDPLPVSIICDHDAEDRATLTRHIGLQTTAAHKAVTAGIQAVSGRMKAQPEGHPNARPRLYVLRDALLSRDEDRTENRLPCGFAEEINEYVWDTSKGRKRGEEPVKAHDHSMDTGRYVIAHVDDIKRAGARVGSDR